MKDARRIEHQEVYSDRFGSGRIEKVKGDLIQVKFREDMTDVRPFRYPQCIESGVLEFENEELQKRITKNIKDEDQKARRLSKRTRWTKRMTVSGPRRIELKEPEVLTRAQFITEAHLNHERENKIIPHFKDLEQVRNAFGAALKEEIQASLNNNGVWNKLSDGVPISQGLAQTTYRFYSPKVLKMPAGAVIAIRYGSHITTGYVHSCESNYVFFSSKAPLDGYLSGLSIQNNPVVILQNLEASLGSKEYDNPDSIAHQLMFKGWDQITTDEPPHYGRENAVKHALRDPITFIWGPPGTGKTETIGEICRHFYNRGQRVLLLSFSNVAVDQAMLRIVKKIPQASAGDILRYGQASLEEAIAHPWLTSESYALLSHPDKILRRSELKDEITAVRGKKDKESVERHKYLTEELNELRQVMINLTKASVQEAAIVGATASKAVCDPIFQTDAYDAVIFDEASMAYVPYIFFAAGKAQKHFICCGDFNQLPPVVTNREKNNLLNIDIFQYTGIVEAISKGKSHRWLQVLETQFRMHSNLSDFASNLMYYSMLKTPSDQNLKLSPVALAKPFAGTSLALADTSRLHSICASRNQSKYNILSAFLTCFLALQAPDSKEVGIIAPYNQQTDLIDTILTDMFAHDPGSKPLASTVHRFQGSEREVMLFDVTDGHDRRAGVMINSRENDYSDRLINVALTRAKGKFVMVADREFVDSRVNGALMIRQLFQYASTSGKALRGSDLLDEMRALRHPAVLFPERKDAFALYRQDLAQAQSSIRIYVAGMMNQTISELIEMNDLLETKEEAGLEVGLYCRSRQDIPENLRPKFSERPGLLITVTIIDQKYVWFNMPHAQMDLHFGRSVMKTMHYPIFRFTGGQTATLVQELLSNKKDGQGKVESEYGHIPYKNFAAYAQETFVCESCGSPMALRSWGQNSILGCTQYPVCTHKKELTAYDVQLYLDEMRDCTNTLGFEYRDLRVHTNEDGKVFVMDITDKKKYAIDNI